MYFDEEDIGALVESRALIFWYGRSELADRGLNDIGLLEDDPEMLRQVAILRDSRNWSQRVRAWERVREMGPSTRGWTRALRELIFQADGWARIFAAESLAWHRCCEAEAVPILLITLESTLETGHFDWSRAACGAIGRYSTLPRPLTDQAVPAMMTALDAADANVQGYAALALGNWGARSRPALVKIADLHDRAEDPLRTHYLEVLQKIDPSIDNSNDARLRALDDNDEGIRAGAIASLGRVGPPAAQALPDLLPLARDDSPDVRRNLALALGDLQVADEDVLHRLQALMEDAHPTVQLAAAYASIRLDSAVRENLSKLRRGLHAASEPVRLLAAWALGEVGGRSRWRSILALKKCLHGEPDQKVRDTAKRALGKLGIA